MGKSTSKKLVNLSVELPSKDHLNYITQALSVVNHYRMQKKQPIHSIETFALNTILDGARSVHEFYQKQVELQKEADGAQEASNDESSTDNSTGLTSETTDTTASTDTEDSASVSAGTSKESATV